VKNGNEGKYLGIDKLRIFFSDIGALVRLWETLNSLSMKILCQFRKY